MANDSSNLSDVDLSVNTSSLGDASNDWNSAVVSTNIGSIDVSGGFSALTQNGIGAGYIASLQNALAKSDKLAINISKLIITTAADQESADQSGVSASSNSTYSSYGGRSSGGGGGANNSSSSGSSNDSSGDVNTGEYNSDNNNENTDINSDNETEEVTITEDEHVSIVKEFQSIFDGELFDYLFQTDNASKIKEQLLSSPNLTDDLKQKISQMDENELQTDLKSIYVSGAMVSDFSKVIITIFDNDLKNNFKNETPVDSAESIKNVYTYLSKQTNFQEQLKEIYFGTNEIENVDEKVIFFTRTFVDTVATASNATYEEILSDSKYKETLLSEIKDLANTFSVIDGAKSLGGDTASKLYSSIIIKEEG